MLWGSAHLSARRLRVSLRKNLFHPFPEGRLFAAVMPEGQVQDTDAVQAHEKQDQRSKKEFFYDRHRT